MDEEDRGSIAQLLYAYLPAGDGEMEVMLGGGGAGFLPQLLFCLSIKLLVHGMSSRVDFRHREGV
jgi:hypothetical protein